MKDFIEETYNAYINEMLSGDEKQIKRFFRIALENVERETRHAAAAEAFTLANNIANKQHYK